MTLSEYYAQQERMRQGAIDRGSLVLSERDAVSHRDMQRGTLSLSSDKAEIAAIKSIASGLTKTVTDSLKAIAKGKDAASIKSAVEEADASIAKQLKRLKSYASNLEGDDEDLDVEDDLEGEDRAPAPKARAKQSVKPTGKSAKAVAASHGKRRSLRRSIKLASEDNVSQEDADWLAQGLQELFDNVDIRATGGAKVTATITLGKAKITITGTKAGCTANVTALKTELENTSEYLLDTGN